MSELLKSLRMGLAAATRVLLIAAVAFVTCFGVILIVLRFVDPPTSAVMLRDQMRGARVQNEWTPLENISPNLIRAVITSEDARFCSHWGIDVHELSRALRSARENGFHRARGASTLTMQVAKNLFLWTDRSVLRKSLELALTPMIEVAWSKRRILEVYLNIAQWGNGVYGAAAAAKFYFRKSADRLDAEEASLLAAALPAPGRRHPKAAGSHTRSLAAKLRTRMTAPYGDFSCVL